MEKKFCSSKQYVNILYKRISNFYSSLWKFFFIFFFLLFSEELKIYLLFFSICIEIFFKRVRIPRVLFIMFAIDSTGLEFYFAKIVSASRTKNSQYPYFFFFLNIRPIMESKIETISKISTIVERRNFKCSRVILYNTAKRRTRMKRKREKWENGKIKTAFAEKGRNA